MTQAEEALAAHMLFDPAVEAKVIELITEHIDKRSPLAYTLVTALVRHPEFIRAVNHMLEISAVKIEQQYTGDYRLSIAPSTMV